MLLVNKQSSSPLYTQLYKQIRSAILSGELSPNTKLPSVRSVSTDLRISRTTVEKAYEQLYLDGFLIIRPRSGYFVNSIIAPLASGNKKSVQDTPLVEDFLTKLHNNPPKGLEYNFHFKNHIPDDALFSDWRKLLNRCLREYRNEMASYQWNAGEPGLRKEIHKYLKTYRNIECHPDQIIIAAGSCNCYSLISRFLITRKFDLALEAPGVLRAQLSFERHGVPTHPVHLDSDGLNMQALRATPAKAVLVNPSPQFPTGIVMPYSRRLELTEWAKANDAIIIEYDRNYNIRYHSSPIPSLQSFAPDQVIYMSTFSKIMFPSIRISYMVLPPDLLEQCKNDCAVPFLMQKTLELFIKEGYWETHLKKTLKRQREKQSLISSALQQEFGNQITISDIEASSYIMVQTKFPMTENELVSKAFKAGVKVNPLSAFATFAPKKPGAVLLSYGGISLEDIPTGIKILRQAWLGD